MRTHAKVALQCPLFRGMNGPISDARQRPLMTRSQRDGAATGGLPSALKADIFWFEQRSFFVHRILLHIRHIIMEEKPAYLPIGLE
jgi:hypothetical protein